MTHSTTETSSSPWRRPLDDADPDQLDAYDYELDEALIADAPAARRDASRLLVYRGPQQSVDHRKFHELGDFLSADDLLVFNDTQVLPARLTVYKETGGRVELFVLDHGGDTRPAAWTTETATGTLELTCMTRSSKPLRPGMILGDPDRPQLPAIEVLAADAGRATVAIDWASGAIEFLQAFGEVPLPPYIVKKRKRAGEAPVQKGDRRRYQTVYAQAPGAVAAPTAGLHFTDELLANLDAQGVERATVTLTVGAGTFAPVRSEKLSDHQMHSEHYLASPDLGEAIAACRQRGGRVVAVGTTTVRALEAEARQDEPFTGQWRATDLFLRPGSEIKYCDGLITNFHLPQSTLLALVATMIGYGAMRKVYGEAIAQRYRFYSYGDASLLLPSR